VEVVHILPTAVAIIPCPFHSSIKQTILSEIEEQSNNMSEFSANEELQHLQHYSVLANDDKYGRFRNWCEQQAERYAKEISGHYIPETVQITDSWFNVSNTGGFQHQHYHANSYMSGVYYVNFDAEKGHCPTSFTKDERSFMQNSSTIQLLKTKYTEFNQNDVVYAKEGELLLFPSHTTHGYKENQGDNRVTISMNIMPTVVTNGDYGWRVSNLTPKERYDAFIISKDFDA
tara:strand:- start:52 stop:744 length:693 start_codon:yes stop_codon:yes gene_type:complete